MSTDRIGTLDQWRALHAVVSHGGYAQAAQKLFRSQSTISYSVSKLEQQLGVPLLEVHGRKAKLTEAGNILYEFSKHLLQQANELALLATSLRQGREAELQLVVDAAYPTEVLMEALAQFARVAQGTRVQLREAVLSGVEEALLEGKADIAISGSVPGEFLGDRIFDVEFIAVAHPQHPLHRLQRTVSHQDLRRQLQVVVRDSGSKQNIDKGWLDAEYRWTVTSLASAAAVIASGLGFGWLPRHEISRHLQARRLKPLPLREGRSYFVSLYLVLGNAHHTGPAAQELANILRNVSQI